MTRNHLASMSYPLVSIIILTYDNGLPHIKNCLSSLSEIDYKSTEIIVVDNASKDETLEYIKKHFPEIKLIENKENLGFAIGNNQALKYALGKYILFLNNDTLVTPNFLDILVKDLERDKNIGAVQPKIRQLADKEKLDACASFLTNTGFLYHFGYSQNQKDEKYNKRLLMYSVKGACFLTRKSIIDKIGLFDEDYFAYFEETDFCHRVWLSGFKVCYEPRSEVYHLGGPDMKVSSEIIFHSYKNRIQTYLKNLEVKTGIRIVSVHITISLLISFAYLIKGRFGYSVAIIKALGWSLLNIFNILKKRKFVQEEVRKVRDDKFLPKILKAAKLSYYKHFFFNPRGYYDFKEI